MAVAAVIGFSVFAMNVPLPYYSIAPGSAIDTAELVVVDDAHAYPPEGDILLTTVALGKVTLVEAIEGWLDPGVDVVPETLIAPPDVDEDELRQINLAAMDRSKQQAIGVAFEALGVDAITDAGAEVMNVQAGSPADGLLQPGNVIVAVDDRPVSTHLELIEGIAAHAPGDASVLRVVRSEGEEPETVEVTLAARPDDPATAFLGVGLSTHPKFSFPFSVDVDSRQIGGPSAGLAFTLAVIDNLTEGELTGGRSVATTGTIELDGSVGEVGGVAQKTIAVKRAGAELFLVPSGELEDARRYAGDDLRVEAVDTLQQALEVLAELGGNGLALPNLGEQSAS